MIIVTSNVSQNAITGWIRTLIEINPTPQALADEIRKVLAEIDELRAERNALIHGLWGTAGPAHSVIVQTTRLERKEIIRDEVVTAADLDDMIDRILEIIPRLREILIAYGAYP